MAKLEDNGCVSAHPSNCPNCEHLKRMAAEAVWATAAQIVMRSEIDPEVAGQIAENMLKRFGFPLLDD